MKKLEMVLTSDHELWRSFVKESIEGSIFLWPEILASTDRHVDLWLGYLDNRVVIGVPVFKDFQGRENLEIPYFNYYGPMFSPMRAEMPGHRRHIWTVSVLDDCIKQLSEVYESLSFRCSPELDDVRAFQWFNYHNPEKGQFELSLNYTAVLNIENIIDVNSFMMEIRNNRRRDFRKANANGIRIEKRNDINAQEILVQMHKKTFARQEIEVSDEEQHMTVNLINNAIASDIGEILIAYDQNNYPISAVLFLWDDFKAYYLIAANDPEYRHLGANTALIMDGINQAKKRGLQALDFIGANSPQRGDYKLSFGAELKPHYICTWHN